MYRGILTVKSSTHNNNTSNNDQHKQTPILTCLYTQHTQKHKENTNTHKTYKTRTPGQTTNKQQPAQQQTKNNNKQTQRP